MSAHDDTISDFEAAEIASAWHSVMTWNDPGVAMYSVTSTGKIHDEKHRSRLLAYVDTCLDAARDADDRGDPPMLEIHESNLEELEAFKEWATKFEIEPSELETNGGAS